MTAGMGARARVIALLAVAMGAAACDDEAADTATDAEDLRNDPIRSDVGGTDDGGEASDAQSDLGTADAPADGPRADAPESDAGDGGGAVDVPAAGECVWLQIAAAGLSTCGLRDDGSLWCWGQNGDGQLGLGAGEGPRSPARVGDGTWQAVSLAASHACAIDADGALWCWGANTLHQLGTSDDPGRGTPGQVGSDTWKAVATASGHSCAIRQDDTLWCWGDNDYGPLGLGDTDPRDEPALVAGAGWDEVSCSTEHTCGLRGAGELYCWGAGPNGELGLGENVSYEQCGGGFNSFICMTEPQRVGGAAWDRVDTGRIHTCGVRDDGGLWCWGGGGSGQLGLGEVGNDCVMEENCPFSPLQVGEQAWRAVSSATSHSCGLDDGGHAWCWGLNSNGQLGTGAEPADEVRTPLPVLCD